jgi:hypothetical protein
VLIVKLFRIAPEELLDQVPVPLKTNEVVPETIAVVFDVKLPPILSVLPFMIVVVVPPKVTVPVFVQLPTSVYVIEVPAKVNSLLQVTLPDVSVAVAFTVIPFAPACVYPPVPKLTLPETVSS